MADRPRGSPELLIDLAIKQHVGQLQLAPGADLPGRDLASVDQVDEVRARHVEDVGSLLGRDLLVVGNDPHVFAALDMVEHIGQPRHWLMATVLVTGGAGYIGSHACVELLAAGWDVVVVDNLSSSSERALDRVRELAPGNLWFDQVDLLDGAGLDGVLAEHPVTTVMHFAGLKAVGESVAEPLRYYENNLAGTVSLLKAMRRHDVRDLVFSSSCTVYGSPRTVPVDESFPIGPASPYGRTKAFIEDLLRDVADSEDGWRVIHLRYFNPVGAHPSGRIGEDPRGIPNNLMPFVMQVAVGRRDRLTVHGDDYDTPDGTCVRDYIHVVDLAEGHVAALAALDRVEGCLAVNLGTGQGYSVLEVVAAASEAVGRDIPFAVGPRRPGDVPAIWAEPALAQELLGWKATRALADMCADHWKWQSANPHGYGSPEATGAQ